MGITLWNLKCMGRLIVRLKTIKYKKDFFYYLSSYPDLGFQAAYFQILSFRLHAFRFFFLGCMLSKFLTKHICSSLRSQIRFNNLNLIPYTEFLVNQIPKAHIMAMNELFSCYYIKLQSGRSNTREPYLLCLTSYILIARMAVLKI